MTRLIDQRGFTIVEVMIAVVVLLTGVLGTLAMLDTANHRSRTAADRQKATSLAREVLEVAKGLPYREVTQDTIVEKLRADSSIAGSSGSPWQVERDGTPFTLTAEVCWLDEPADGLGSRAAGGFCAGSESGGTTDNHPVDYKRVTVTASWHNGAGRGSIRQSTLLTTRGGGDAPAVSSIRLTSPSESPITSSATESASFAVTTSADAASVVWSVDGAQQGSATGSGRNWTFTWQLPQYDGTYDVSAQAFEPSGIGGESRSVTVVVNRFAPFAPTGFNAGRNGTLVEAEWTANRERDVIGYRVYRQPQNGQVAVACEFTTETWCVDPNAPAIGSGQLEYWVVAVDRDELGHERDGAPSTRIDVNIANNPPSSPSALTLSKDAQGNTVLSWTAATDPDAGDGVASYRIYRDGIDITDRYDRVDGSETTATDARTGGVEHQYWITAVDTHLHESTPLGPVTG